MMDDQHYSPQQPGQVLGYSYDEDDDVQSLTQSPSSLHHFPSTFDSPARSISQQFLPPPTSSPSNILSSQSFAFSPSFTMSQDSLWNNNTQQAPTSDFQPYNNRAARGFPQESAAAYITTSEPDMFSHVIVPRGYEGFNQGLVNNQHNHGLPSYTSFNNNGCGEVKHEIFQRLPQNEIVYPSLETPQEYSNYPVNNNDEYVASPSPYPSLEALRYSNGQGSHALSSDVSDDGVGLTSREMTAVEGDDLMDEPYAKLIYRALMSKEDRSMVLQEIYQWFKDNTNKGSDPTSKGWMNSIRHNLSMNAAFKKTERKAPGEESKKSTEWVLEDFAIKDGVQSTTRYRKGAQNKKYTRSDTPTASRQRSGQRGGISTRNSLRMRKSHDYHHRRPKLEFGNHSSSMRGFPSHLQHMDVMERQREPLTPPQPDLLVQPQHASAGYYGFHQAQTVKMDQQYGLGMEETYGLEHVQGVHLDGGPVFAGSVDMGYGSGFGGMNGFENRS